MSLTFAPAGAVVNAAASGHAGYEEQEAELDRRMRTACAWLSCGGFGIISRDYAGGRIFRG